MIERLLESLDKATCNFCAVKEIERRLVEAGYSELALEESWNVKPGGRHYIKKNSSSIFAFHIGSGMAEGEGFRIVAAHSDSPGFKLKPNPEIYGENGVTLLNVEKYGGGILYTWFDRPLSMAGRVLLKSDNPFRPEERVFDLRRPLATIPHLAIHFNRAVNEGNALSVQKDMKPVIGRFSKEEIEEYKKEGGVVKKTVADHLGVSADDIIGQEIWLYPVGAPVIDGWHGEYFQSGRIDDLSMALTGLEAFIAASKENSGPRHTRVLAIFDNEETGSGTKQGAHSPFLKNAMERICRATAGGDAEAFHRNLQKSFLISADDAHAYHPNYPEKHDPTNHPYIGGGPVVKINANSKYMTDGHSSAVFAALCERAGVKCQYFVNHGDVAGGSTLGNILTGQLEIAGVDMGCAIWAMHSACETAGVSDHEETEKVFRYFYL
ncbi:MAG: M18 family aminopeptidase [Muribaculaceae bacterium]|nr:M18 family aminopeptidase [Muribaculaceae bacterium]